MARRLFRTVVTSSVRSDNNDPSPSHQEIKFAAKVGNELVVATSLANTTPRKLGLKHLCKPFSLALARSGGVVLLSLFY